MVVEFLGLPGAGKSTLARLAAEALVERGIAVEYVNRTLTHGAGPPRRWLRKAGRVIEGLVRTPRCSALTIRRIHETRQRSPRDFLITAFNWLLVTTLVRRAAASRKVFLLDQGIAQALWSVGFSAQGQAWQETMRQVASCAPAPDMIFLVHAGLLNIKDRLALRRHNLSRLSGTQAINSEPLVRASALLEAVADIMRSRQVPIIVVNNEHHRQLSDNTIMIVCKIIFALRHDTEVQYQQ
jgi:thymidylate kinase